MKKMTFALACASTAALFAGTIHQATFEDYSKGFSGLSGKDDAGSNSTSVYWTYLGGGADDGSTVKAYKGADDPDNLDKPAGTQLSGEVGDKYLELSTEGGTLWRSVNEATDTALGAEKAVDATKGLYIDTMVQFTPTEDGGAPEVGSDDQIAIWLNVGEDGKTNLCVRAAQAHDTGTSSTFNPTTYVLAGTENVQPGAWYRLTINAIADVDQRMAKNEGYTTGITGFQILLDGVPLRTESKTFTDGYMALACDAGEWGWLEEGRDDDLIDLLESGTIFPSLKGEVTASSLTAVGFKGSGALDDLTITDENPIKEEPAPEGDVAFTITTADGVTASWSTTADGEFTTYAAGAKAPAGTIYVKLTNADGASKVVVQTVSADDGASNAYDLSAETFGWDEYLGAAIAENTYGVDTAAEIVLFQKGVAAGLATAGLTFKQTADIDMSESGAFAGVGGLKGATPFKGVYDGDGKQITGVTFTHDATYRGFFNSVEDATIQNLTVNVAGFDSTSAAEFGAAAFVGQSTGTVLFKNLTAKGTLGTADKPCNHSAAGILVRGVGTFENCVNEMAIVSRSDNTKVGGMVAIQNGAVTLKNCSNKGALTAGKGSGATDYVEGVGGLVGYEAGKGLAIEGCSNTGVITDESNANKASQLVGRATGTVTASGTNTGLAGMKAIDKSVDGLDFATVADGVATYVKDEAAVAGANLAVTAPGQTVTLANEGDAITLDMTAATAEVTTTAADCAVVQDGNVYTAAVTWASVLGTAVDGAFVIDDAAELAKFGAYADKIGTKDVAFALSADIDMAAADPWAGVGKYADGANIKTTPAFEGTFDGAGHKISNICMTERKGSGFFNVLRGATVQNLVIDTVTYASDKTGGKMAAKMGGAMLAGNIGPGTTVKNVTLMGSNASAANPVTYNGSGLTTRIEACGSPILIENCVNKAAVYCSYSKVAGICSIVSGVANDVAPVTFKGCVNEGTIRAVGTTTWVDNGITRGPGSDGVCGILSYMQGMTAASPVSFIDCKDSGTELADSTLGACAGIFAKGGNGLVANASGTNETKKDVPAVKVNGGTITGLRYATIEGEKAIYVADSEAKAGANLKVMLSGGTVTLANIGDSITLDMTLATATVTTTADNAEVKKEGNVYTVVSAKPPYPAYIGDDAAKQAKYDAWATANNIAAADFPDAEAANQKAYLLNAAPGKAAEDAEKAFKIKSITVAADGTVTVTPPDGQFNGTVEIQGAATLAGPWAAKADNAGQKFFKAVLK